MSKLTAKQTAFIEAYCNAGSETYNNAYQSAITAGYVRNTAIKAGTQIVESSRVKDAIAAYRAKTAAKLDHNRQIAIDKLNADYTNLHGLAIGGNIQAIQARTAIIRELNAISNLHSSTVNVPIAEPETFTPAERARMKIMTKNLLTDKETA